MEIKVKLSLRGHCIETEAKNEFKRRMDNYFSSENVTQVDEGSITLLSDFIRTSNFPEMRSKDKRLSGDIESDIILYRDENNNIQIEYMSSE